MSKGRLILVPTPIGNLGDITLRAIETLKAADLVAAEDTRVTGKLLHLLGISKPMVSFHSNNEHRVLEKLMGHLNDGKTVALCSDAGSPGISDPGFLAVREAIKNEIPLESLPGATAFVPALVCSGLPCDKFYFEGFLPHKKGRQTRLQYLAELPCTSILYESPHRMLKTLSQIGEFIGEDRQLVVMREITKKFESIYRGTPKELFDQFTTTPPKGEFVIVIAEKT
ncbi:MAG: 16S rRNA (cytidine1402-2'-O)-methyltransferase [Sphingobacteriales bacterium]|jgi:16S rRNA (cytidine1402-2'-O)-methyltransferase